MWWEFQKERWNGGARAVPAGYGASGKLLRRRRLEYGIEWIHMNEELWNCALFVCRVWAKPLWSLRFLRCLKPLTLTWRSKASTLVSRFLLLFVSLPSILLWMLRFHRRNQARKPACWLWSCYLRWPNSSPCFHRCAQVLTSLSHPLNFRWLVRLNTWFSDASFYFILFVMQSLVILFAPFLNWTAMRWELTWNFDNDIDIVLSSVSRTM